MSRSYRHNPYTGMTNAPSEKQDKRICNRRLRRRNKQRLLSGEEHIFLTKEEAMNIAVMDKDGKFYFDPDTDWGKKLMRK